MRRRTALHPATGLTIVGYALVAALCGCGTGPAGGAPAEVLTVAQALDLSAARAASAGETAAGSTAGTYDQLVVAVRGYVLAAPTGVRLCTGLAGSFPPQCGAPSIELHGVDVQKLPERDRASGVAWSGETTVSGVLGPNVLTVRS